MDTVLDLTRPLRNTRACVWYDIITLSSGTIATLIHTGQGAVIDSYQNTWALWARDHYAPEQTWQSNHAAFTLAGCPGWTPTV